LMQRLLRVSLHLCPRMRRAAAPATACPGYIGCRQKPFDLGSISLRATNPNFNSALDVHQNIEGVITRTVSATGFELWTSKVANAGA
jgi:hypothetical protein